MSKLYLKLPALIKTPYYQKVLRTQRAYLQTYWPLWEASGSVSNDISGNARHAAYTGVDLGQPGIGDGHTCPYFDGANDYVNVYSTSLRDAYNGAEVTRMAWFKVYPTAWTDGQERIIFRLYADGDNLSSFYKGVTNSHMGFLHKAGGVAESWWNLGYDSTAWMHIAITVSESADVARGYINGVQVGADQTGLGVWAGQISSFLSTIGAGIINFPDYCWHGWLAHVPVWSIALTGAEVANLAKL